MTRWGPPIVVAGIASVALAATGLVFGRADVAALGLPLGLWAVIAIGQGRPIPAPRLRTDAPRQLADGEVATRAVIDADAEAVHVALLLGASSSRDVVVAPGERIDSISRIRHSGPWTPVIAIARGFDADGAAVGVSSPYARVDHALAPGERPLPDLPLARRLTGLHGAHEGWRPGQGGDFRDIHPYAPGDELRRVDWKATARLARRPGDLHVRRTNSTSEQTVAIVLDAVDDVGEIVSTWPDGDPDASGITSLDLARDAARAIATAAIGVGDRVALQELGLGGRLTRGGAGSRHLARLVAVIATAGPREPAPRWARTPPVPRGAVVFVLSTFLDGIAAAYATEWLGSGHRVVAVDTLPLSDPVRLRREEQVALRLVLAERRERIAAIERAGAETVVWARDPGAALRGIAGAHR